MFGIRMRKMVVFNVVVYVFYLLIRFAKKKKKN